MDKLTSRHWTLVSDKFNIAWLILDKKNASANTLNAEILEELLSLLQSLEKDNLPLGLVIKSGKSNGFIAGADIQQFKKLETPDAAFNLICQGQVVFNHLASLPFPTVALIHGFCLGGGLELALACRYRIVRDDPKTKLGLPEVLLGIHPGWGGSVRLPRLIGAIKAMDLILSGRSISAKTAFKMGVVDCIVPERHEIHAVEFYLQTRPTVRTATRIENLTNLNFIRSFIGKYLQKQVTAKVNRAHYPAPFAVIDHWVEHGVQNDAAFITEAKSISQLVVGETSRNLARVFFLQDKLKSLGCDAKSKIESVHVVGAGVMGGDIAAWCVLQGMRVTLEDQNEKAIAAALKRALLLFKKIIKEPHLIKAAQDRLIPDNKGFGTKKADLIIEAIVEKVEAKKALFLRLEQLAKKEAIFATNTSTIPLDDLDKDLSIRNRLIGLHFFNPVAKMPLVEVVSGKYSDPEIVQKGLSFVRSIGKLPLLVKSSPGFLVNRILMPYLLESILLLESGVLDYAIDKAAVEFGMPMGPIELADTVGLDVCLYGAESLTHYLGGSIPAELRKRVEQGNLGKKSGQGFYQWTNGKPVKKNADKHYRLPDDIIDRLVLRILNEAVACLREGIVTDKDFIDAGMLFGTGFPPFRGGPMHYIAEQGEALLLQRLNLLSQRYGQRFLPDSGWQNLDAK